ncbi:hypothetical protein [Streptomyces sp. NPDC004296]|uniref:hypothetical protein n=1 Tax=Streptomyces sp. NPDC004296 TaxID=3364697 RepID=UPI0036C14E59
MSQNDTLRVCCSSPVGVGQEPTQTIPSRQMFVGDAGWAVGGVEAAGAGRVGEVLPAPEGEVAAGAVGAGAVGAGAAAAAWSTCGRSAGVGVPCDVVSGAAAGWGTARESGCRNVVAEGGVAVVF